MNWDAISAISQLIGSLAVVLSVLYLAVQVHQGTRVARLATQDAAATALRDVTKPFMENAELERIWRVGLEDISALSVEERARFFHAALPMVEGFRDNPFPLCLRTDGQGALAKAGRDSSGITSSRLAWRITGNFGPKFSPNAFAILLTHSNHPRISARWALCSKRNEAKGEREHVARIIRHVAG